MRGEEALTYKAPALHMCRCNDSSTTRGLCSAAGRNKHTTGFLLKCASTISYPVRSHMCVSEGYTSTRPGVAHREFLGMEFGHVAGYGHIL